MENEVPVWALKVKELLATQGRKQGWLAKMLGTTDERITRLLKGQEGAVLQEVERQQIATLLGVPYDWLWKEGANGPA